jgi:DNA-binding NarL/FixJ family response regulator
MDNQQLNFPKILFVDDEPSVLRAMQRLFYDDHYDVLTASGGQAALELLKENGPVQLIISDQRMPGMTGVEFLQQVKQQWPDTRRVILSAFPDSDVLLTAVNEGRVHRFLVKPWDNDAIVTVVKEMLDEYELLVNFRQSAEELARNNLLLSRTNEHLSVILADVLANMRREAVHPDASVHPEISGERRPYESLSSREREILLAIASGHSPKAIASDLGLSIKTVSTYKKRMFAKMLFKNDAELIGYTLKSNLLPDKLL